MTVSILYGKSYASRVAMKFIDDEYDIIETKGSGTIYEPYTPFPADYPVWNE